MAKQTFPKETKFEELPAADEGFHWARNLMSQDWYLEAYDTPLCCRASSETYWSM